MNKLGTILPVAGALLALAALFVFTLGGPGDDGPGVPPLPEDDEPHTTRTDGEPGSGGGFPGNGGGEASPGGGTGAGSGETGSIAGTLRVVDTGAPVSGAEALIWSRGHRRTTKSDAAGRFRFPDVPVGSMRLRVRTPEHEDPPTLTVNVTAGRESAVDLEVWLGAMIRGVVRDVESRAPIPGARIQHQSSMIKLTTAGPDGTYVLPGFGQGIALLQAEAEGYPKARFTVPVPERTGEVVHDIDLTRGAVVRGTVTDTRGAPVAGARVGILRGGGERPETGPNGRFELTAVPAERSLWISAECDGYVPAQTDSIRLRPGEEVDDVRIVLRRGGAVSGRVFLSDGGPANGATVRLVPLQPLAGVRRLPFAKTRANGEFELTAVSPGDHRLTATLSGSIAAFTEVRGVTEGGEVANVEVRLGAALTIRGEVRDHSGKALAGVMVLAQPVRASGASRWGNARTNLQGQFEVGGLSEGTYRVEARAARGGLRTTPVEAAAGAEDISLVLPAPGNISGRVVNASGDPVSSYSLRIVPSEAGVQGGRVFTRVSDSGGAFRVPGIAPGTYEVSASSPEGFSDPQPPVVVTEGGDVTGLVLTLRSGGTVRGTVLGSEGLPVAGVTVSLVFEGATQGGLRPTSGRGRTDAQGAFLVKNLRAGTYRAMATMRGVYTRPETVRVGAGGEQSLILRFPPTGSLGIRVVSASGVPLEHAWIQLRDEAGNRIPARTGPSPAGLSPMERAAAERAAQERARRTDAQGACFREGVPAGRVTVRVLLSGYEDSETTATVPPRGTGQVRVTLKPGTSGMDRKAEERNRREGK